MLVDSHVPAPLQMPMEPALDNPASPINSVSPKSRTTVAAYMLPVIAYGCRYDVPVTRNTRILSVLREIAELTISHNAAGSLGELNVAVFHNEQPLQPETPVGNLPEDTVLHFHTSLETLLMYGRRQSFTGGLDLMNGSGAEVPLQSYSSIAAAAADRRPRPHALSAGAGSDDVARFHMLQAHSMQLPTPTAPSVSYPLPPTSAHERGVPLSAPTSFRRLAHMGPSIPLPARAFSYSGMPHRYTSAPPGNPWGLEERGPTYRVPVRNSRELPTASPLPAALGAAGAADEADAPVMTPISPTLASRLPGPPAPPAPPTPPLPLPPALVVPASPAAQRQARSNGTNSPPSSPCGRPARKALAALRSLSPVGPLRRMFEKLSAARRSSRPPATPPATPPAAPPAIPAASGGASGGPRGPRRGRPRPPTSSLPEAARGGAGLDVAVGPRRVEPEPARAVEEQSVAETAGEAEERRGPVGGESPTTATANETTYATESTYVTESTNGTGGHGALTATDDTQELGTERAAGQQVSVEELSPDPTMDDDPVRGNDAEHRVVYVDRTGAGPREVRLGEVIAGETIARLRVRRSASLGCLRRFLGLTSEQLLYAGTLAVMGEETMVDAAIGQARAAGALERGRPAVFFYGTVSVSPRGRGRAGARSTAALDASLELYHNRQRQRSGDKSASSSTPVAQPQPPPLPLPPTSAAVVPATAKRDDSAAPVVAAAAAAGGGAVKEKPRRRGSAPPSAARAETERPRRKHRDRAGEGEQAGTLARTAGAPKPPVHSEAPPPPSPPPPNRPPTLTACEERAVCEERAAGSQGPGQFLRALWNRRPGGGTRSPPSRAPVRPHSAAAARVQPVAAATAAAGDKARRGASSETRPRSASPVDRIRRLGALVARRAKRKSGGTSSASAASNGTGSSGPTTSFSTVVPSSDLSGVGLVAMQQGSYMSGFSRLPSTPSEHASSVTPPTSPSCVDAAPLPASERAKPHGRGKTSTRDGRGSGGGGKAPAPATPTPDYGPLFDLPAPPMPSPPQPPSILQSRHSLRQHTGSGNKGSEPHNGSDGGSLGSGATPRRRAVSVDSPGNSLMYSMQSLMAGAAEPGLGPSRGSDSTSHVTPAELTEGLRVTVRDPRDAERFHFNIPVEPDCSAFVIRDWMFECLVELAAEEAAARGTAPEPVDNYPDVTLYDLFCGDVRVADETVTFREATGMRNDCIFSLFRCT